MIDVNGKNNKVEPKNNKKKKNDGGRYSKRIRHD